MATALFAMASACSARASTPRNSSPPSSTVTSSRPPAAHVDWQHVEASVVPGWTLKDSEGDGPFVDVVQGGTRVGTFEILRLPLATLDEFRSMGPSPAGQRRALLGHIDRYFADTARDRAVGCPPGWSFRGDEPVIFDSPGGLVVRYGYTTTTKDGTVAERGAHLAGVRGSTFVLVGIEGSGDGACAPVEDGFALNHVDSFAAALADAIAQSDLPPPEQPKITDGRTGPRPVYP